MGLAALLTAPANAAEPQPRQKPAPRRKKAPAAATKAPPRIPDIDGPPPSASLRPGLEPAPVPNTNPQRPMADRAPQPKLELGVPTPPSPYEGQTFSATDPSPDRRPAQSGGGLRLPSPGATVRLPF